MSIGQPCKYCTHGKMRPFHFCWDQAVILCDNSKCKSILNASPSQCIIKSNAFLPAHQPLSGLDQQNLLSDGSGGSSSGVYSEARSFLQSPAQSRKSGTDEEVELLLKAAFSPLNFKDQIDTSCGSSGLVTHTQVSPKRHTARSDSSEYEGFFELLNDLDLELPTQSVKTESHSKSSFVETGLDVVTTELEEWMKDFELPSLGTDNSGIAPSGCQQLPNEILRTVSSGGCQQLPGEILMGVSLSGQQPLDKVLKVESVATTRLQGSCIPSQRSAFSSLDASNEESASFINSEQNSLISSFSCLSSSSERNETSEYFIQQCESSYLSVPFTNEFVIENMSAIPTRFMSPTASALSEDSGYNEEDGKASSGLELAGGEENLKVSSKTFAFSSKNVDDTTKDIFTKQPHQINFKELIQTNLDWPLMSDSHTLIVLPAMVTTDNNLTGSPQELSTLPSITQTTRQEEICTTPQDERETINFSNEQLERRSQAPAEQCVDNEDGTMFSENHDPTLEEESHGVSISVPFNTSVISQPSECIISEGSSHSTFSEPKNESENDGNSTPSLDTSSGASLCPGEHKKKRGRRPRSKHKLGSLSDHGASKSDPSDNKHTVPDNIASRIRKGECKKIKVNRKEVKRRKSKISGFRYNEGGKQNKPSKKGPLKKPCKREQSKRRILPRSARQQTSSLESQPPTSSRENHSAQAFHESDDKRDSATTQNPSGQIPERRTNHLSRR